MPERLIFKNEKTGREFEIVSVSEDKTEITLKVKGGVAQFTEPYSKERFKEMGYSLKKIQITQEEEDDE
jgi:hypothetical protein